MANTQQYQFLFSKQPKLTIINGAVTLGATGAVTGTSFGAGVLSVTRLATGIYKVKLKDNYVTYLGATCHMSAGPSGATVNDGSFVTGTQYQIITVGTTNWVGAGWDSDYNPAVGGTFVATGAGGAGTGTVQAIAASNITNIEVALNPQVTMKNLFPAQGRGSSIVLNTYGLPASGQVPVLTNPLSGSRLSYRFWFRDSSVLAQ